MPKYTTEVSPAQVLGVGAGGLNLLASSSAVLDALHRAYGEAIRELFVLGLVFACLSLPASCAMEWLNIKRESVKRRQLDDNSEDMEILVLQEGARTPVVQQPGASGGKRFVRAK